MNRSKVSERLVLAAFLFFVIISTLILNSCSGGGNGGGSLGPEPPVNPNRTCTVTNSGDSGAGTLREKIGDSACDTINFDNDYTITLDSAKLTIANNITIDGVGHNVTVSGGNTVPVFLINSGVTATLNNLTIANGKAGSCGGIENNGTLTVTNSTLSGNRARFYGGGIINRGTLSVINSTLSGNSADTSGGGILNSGILKVTNSTLSDNAAGTGGGIYNEASLGIATVKNCILSGNVGYKFGGGGIFNHGDLTVTNSTLSGNFAGTGGGGIFNHLGYLTITNSTLSGNSATYGGGIRNESAATVTNCTLSGNFATYGGGIHSVDDLTVTNSTLSGNSAAYGGGIYSVRDLTVTNSTLYGNFADTGGGIYIELGGPSMTNTIIANSTSGGDCTNPNGFITNANNLVQDGSCSAPISGDPKLGPLADNGGLTQTFALMPGSPAIDAGTRNGCPAADQRGVTRPQGRGCDIGAYELENR